MKKWKAVVFDNDGTLLNNVEGDINSVKYTIEKLGYEPLSEELLHTFTGPPVKMRMQEIYDLSEAEAMNAMQVFREHYEKYDLLKSRVYPGIKEILQYLRKREIKIAVATNKRTDMAQKVLAYCGLANEIEVISGSDREGKMTKTQILKSALTAIGVTELSDAVMVGDSSNDAVAAREVGLDFIGLTYGFGFKTEEDVKKFPYVAAASGVAELYELIKRTYDK